MPDEQLIQTVFARRSSCAYTPTTPTTAGALSRDSRVAATYLGLAVGELGRRCGALSYPF